jgi:hypothetical protein
VIETKPKAGSLASLGDVCITVEVVFIDNDEMLGGHANVDERRERQGYDPHSTGGN